VDTQLKEVLRVVKCLLYKRVPKIGFTSRVEKPLAINVDKVKSIAS